jgi:hypothetical protein
MVFVGNYVILRESIRFATKPLEPWNDPISLSVRVFTPFPVQNTLNILPLDGIRIELLRVLLNNHN